MHIVATQCCYPECYSAPSDMLALPLCERHALKVYREVKLILAMADPTAAVLASLPKPDEPRTAVQKLTPGEVYFVRFGDRIKIGFSTNVKTRMKAVPHDAILATMPGTPAVESRMHKRFAHLRITGEWFRPGPDLMAFIDSLKAA